MWRTSVQHAYEYGKSTSVQGVYDCGRTSLGGVYEYKKKIAGVY
jgi:hypothetical protein